LDKAAPFAYPISVENRYIEESPFPNQTRSPIIKVTRLQPEIRRTVKCQMLGYDWDIFSRSLSMG
jgi:hypothetical protein